MVILPVTAALTVAVFSVGGLPRGVDLARQRGRHRGRRAAVLLHEAPADPRRRADPQLDPQGRWLMAAGQSTTPTATRSPASSSAARSCSTPPGSPASPRGPALDPGTSGGRHRPRARPPAAADRPARLASDRRPDNQVEGDFDQLGLTVTVLDDNGALRELPVGPFDPGTLDGRPRGCAACRVGCQLETISFGGPSALVEAMHGTVRRSSRYQVDGKHVPGVLDRDVARRPGPQTGTKRRSRASVRRGRAPDRRRSSAGVLRVVRRDQPRRPACDSPGAARAPGQVSSARSPPARPARSRCGRSARAESTRSGGRRAC